MYDMTGVPSHEVPYIWDRVAHFIQAALDRTEGELDLSDIQTAILDRDMQLWVLLDGKELIGAVVTQIIPYPKKKACRIVAMGGDVSGYFDDIDELLSTWAGELGCDRMEIVGRKGWTRAIRHLGYNEAYSYVTKTLGQSNE
jgi:hypothetical protein